MSSLSQELSSLFPLFQVVETIIGPVSAHEVQLCTQNPLRWALWLSYNIVPSETLFISTVPGNVQQNSGILVANGSSTAVDVFNFPVLNFRDHGPLVQQAWYGGTQPTTTQTWCVIEVLLLTEGATF